MTRDERVAKIEALLHSDYGIQALNRADVQWLIDELKACKPEKITPTKYLDEDGKIDYSTLKFSLYQTNTSAWCPEYNGVFVLHTPTGMYAESREERTQHLNKARAIQLLIEKLKKVE